MDGTKGNTWTCLSLELYNTSFQEKGYFNTDMLTLNLFDLIQIEVQELIICQKYFI